MAARWINGAIDLIQSEYVCHMGFLNYTDVRYVAH